MGLQQISATCLKIFMKASKTRFKGIFIFFKCISGEAAGDGGSKKTHFSHLKKGKLKISISPSIHKIWNIFTTIICCQTVLSDGKQAQLLVYHHLQNHQISSQKTFISTIHRK